MTKYQDLKNEVKRSWKLKNAKAVPVIVGASWMMTKNLTEILKTIPGNIVTNELQLETVRGSVTILKRTLGTKLWEQKTSQLGPWIVTPYRNKGGYFEPTLGGLHFIFRNSHMKMPIKRTRTHTHTWILWDMVGLCFTSWNPPTCGDSRQQQQLAGTHTYVPIVFGRSLWVSIRRLHIFSGIFIDRRFLTVLWFFSPGISASMSGGKWNFIFLRHPEDTEH